MNYTTVKIPDGVFRNGTPHQAKGRWYFSHLCRWHDGVLQPVGGWTEGITGATSGGGSVRGIQTVLSEHRAEPYVLWLDLAGTGHFWSPSGDTGITLSPAVGAGFVGGQWSVDTFGKLFVFVADWDQTLRSLDLDASVTAGIIAGSPTCRAVVTAAERYVIALCADSNPRLVKWAARETLTDWTASPTNDAGDFELATSGEILGAARTRSEILIWTTTDVWSMRHTGGDFVFSITQAGPNCGAISRKSFATRDTGAVWMGPRSFFTYDGYVRPLECDVSDYVFGDMNASRVGQIFAVTLTDFNEVWWFYPSSGATENDRYVVYNWVKNTWMLGNLSRSAGLDKGTHLWPLLGTANGLVYEHEKGTSYTGADAPYVESGPIEIGDGNTMMSVLGMIPDEKTTGQVNVTFYTRPQPNSAETTHGPYTLTALTDLRIPESRQLRWKISQVTAGWRFGDMRLDLRQGGHR